MTTAARPMSSPRQIDWKRIVIIVLCVVALLSLLLSYASGISSATEESVTYSGMDFLSGAPDGKSHSSPHPMLLGAFVALALTAILMLFNKGKSFIPVLFMLLTTLFMVVFRVDVYYQSKVEFGMLQDGLRFGIGYAIGAAAPLAAFMFSIWRALSVSRANKRRELDTHFASANLPGGYKMRSLRETIAVDFKKHWPVYLLILPTVIYYLVWCYGPMYGIIIAFNDYSPRGGMIGSKWVGLQWFRDFFRSPFAFRTIRNTLVISLLNLAIGFPAPIILALLLNEVRSVPFKRTVQTITYMPYFISLVVLCGMLTDFAASDGLFSSIAKLFGGTETNFLGHHRYFRTLYIGSEIWQKLGWDSIIFLSALAGIDQELYEAATIDGAGKLKQTWHVTLPGIMPTIAILLILRMGAMMSVGYEKIILLYNGNTYETADVISSYVYRKGIGESNFSFSTAVNLFNSIINFVLVVLANKISGVLTETSLW